MFNLFVQDNIAPYWIHLCLGLNALTNFINFTIFWQFPFNKICNFSLNSTTTTVFLDTRLSKSKHPRKRFQNFRQSCVLSTDRIEIHQSQPLVWPSDLVYVMLAGCDWWISIRSVDIMYDWRKFWKCFRGWFDFESRVSRKTVVILRFFVSAFNPGHYWLNCAKARKAIKEVGGELFPIPKRSKDVNPILKESF